MKIHKIGKYTCKIGQNSNENWSILEEADPNHLFLHLTSFPSCFVIVDSSLLMNEFELIECANICKDNTKYRKLKSVYVDCTTCSNVIKGEIQGEIIYKSLRKIRKIKV